MKSSVRRFGFQSVGRRRLLASQAWTPERTPVRSKILGMSGPIMCWTQGISEYHKQDGVTLQSVFEEEVCMVHNIYGGFKEKKVRIFMDYSPTLRTPKGGGHLPSILKKNGEVYSLPVEKAELLMGFPIGWTDLNV